MTATKYQSVYYQPSKKGKKGYYYYSVYLGKDPLTGKRRIKKARRDYLGNEFKNAREAHLEVERIIDEEKSGNNVLTKDITYADFMDKVFLPYYKGRVQKSTWITRQPIFEKMKERFGAKKLSQILPGDVLQYKTWLLNEVSEDRYSQSYVSLVYGAFRKTLDTAVDMDYLSKNPSRIKKATGAISKGSHNIECWTLEEFRKVISKCYLGDIEGELAYVTLNLYYFTGMRVSEGLALYWSNVSFEDKTIRINHTLFREPGGRVIRKNCTKTVNGMRTIDIPDDLISILKDWKKIQYNNLPQDGDDHYVLSATDQPLHRSTIGNIINRYAKLANVHPIKAKELRASHASLLINKYNVDILLIAKRLGHAKPTTTLRYYSELWGGRNRTISRQLDGALGEIQHPDHSLVDFNGNQFVINKKSTKSLPSED